MLAVLSTVRAGATEPNCGDGPADWVRSGVGTEDVMHPYQIA
jgi:hypothetical protein